MPAQGAIPECLHVDVLNHVFSIGLVTQAIEGEMHHFVLCGIHQTAECLDRLRPAFALPDCYHRRH